MEETDVGILRYVSEVQEEKAASPMDRTEVGTTSEVMPEQP